MLFTIYGTNNPGTADADVDGPAAWDVATGTGVVDWLASSSSPLGALAGLESGSVSTAALTSAVLS